MEIVYIVYYDNGMDYEDHQVSVDRIFASRESADKYQNEKTQSLLFTIISKEDYYKQDADDINYSYEDFYDMTWNEWSMYQRDARYYVMECPLHP